MDFSFLQPHSRYFLLRDITALKKRWPYYAIACIDPVLRFAWIFYAIFTYDKQHSTIASFLIAFAEVTRRGIWTLIRVENEHCANVAQYKASRDVPLPYRIEPLVQNTGSPESAPFVQQEVEGHDGEGDAAGSRSSGVQVAGAEAIAGELRGERVEEGTMLRRRRGDTMSGARSIRRILAEAHKQDFEKKRKPVEEVGKDEDEEDDEGASDDEADEEDCLDIAEAEDLASRGRSKDGEE
jgi:xenotropic and polytropic retrovirus receptor 1